MASILLIDSNAASLVNFRGDWIAALHARGDRVFVTAPAATPALQAKLTNLGALFFPLPLQRTGTNPWQDLLTLVFLLRLMRRLRPEKVLAYTVKPIVYGLLAARLAGIAHRYAMITGLGYVFTDGPASMRRALLKRLVVGLYRAALTGARGVLFLNHDDPNTAKASGVIPPRVPCHVIPGEGVNLAHFTPAPLPDAPVFLMIARLLRDKGVYDYVAAARLLKKTHPHVVCRLLGPFDSNPSAIHEEEVRAWIAEGLVDYLGSVNDVRPALREASVVVLPSYREGTPRSLLEAMAMGRPLIATDVPGCREVVQPGVNGLLVPVRDPEALANAMRALADDASRRTAWGLQSLRLAQEKYDVHTVNARMIAILGLNGDKT